MEKYNKVKYSVLLAALASPFFTFAQETVKQDAPSVFSNALFNTLLILIILLLVIIATLSSVIKNLGESDVFEKKYKAANTGSSKVLTVLFIFLSMSSFSQNKTGGGDWSVGGLDSITFFFMLAVIVGELIVIASLLGVIKRFTKPESEIRKIKEKPKEKTIFDKINASVEIEKEAEILLDHDYDGIRELDNNLPPWWINGFYVTILTAVIYMIHYHVAHTGDLQATEYKNEVKNAELAIAEHMKNSADNVDETTVKMLTDASALSSGKELFISTCAACHGRLGEGGVGPNLTDDYWLHGGGIQEIFKTVKYGWPDKGMKSWKEDLSPVQIAQVASFIKTLRGTNPPNGKEKQGELFIEQGTVKDTSLVVDSPKTLTAGDTLNKK